MPRKVGSSTAPVPKRRVAATGHKLPPPIQEGEVVIDNAKKSWRIGHSIGIGGFGEIYTASDDIARKVPTDTLYVIKIEPNENGPLFVETNFYLRAAKSEMIDTWMKTHKLKCLGVPRFVASGSHQYRGQSFRFLVMDRFGDDLHKLFILNNKCFPLKTVLNLGIQIVTILEYIHAQGYIHADIKGSNLLRGFKKSTENTVFLVDYGLVNRYAKHGTHNENNPDKRFAHDGTIEFTSRDAHIGTHSRRGDMEILGYNMVQWLCGKLPWEDNLSNPEYVKLQKNGFMSNIPSFMRSCFPNDSHPEFLPKYLHYVANLKFNREPDYNWCRSVFREALKNAGLPDDNKLVFTSAVPVSQKSGRKVTKKAVKRRSTSESENENCPAVVKKAPRSSPRSPCKPKNRMSTRSSPTAPILRSSSQLMYADPDKAKRPSSGRGATTKRRQKQQDEETKPQLDNPTPAMLAVLQRTQQRNVSSLDKDRKKSSSGDSPDCAVDIPTYAMEQVMRRISSESSHTASSPELPKPQRKQSRNKATKPSTKTVKPYVQRRRQCRQATATSALPTSPYYFQDNGGHSPELFSSPEIF